MSPYGVVQATGANRAEGWLAGMTVSLADGGSGCPGLGVGRSPSTGCGRAFDDPAHARMIAIAEAAERYSAYEPPTAGHRWARAAELDGPVLDTTRLPRCSAAELAHPACPVTPFDADAPVRWIQGLDLVSRERTWMPAVMSTYRLHPARPAERFWYQLSTGFAVHTDPVEAVVRAILEVIERDAIALTWLQRMPLRPIPAEAHSPMLDRLLAAAQRHFVHTLLLDATTDLGVPTVYCLQIAEHDPRARHVVGCAADRTLSAAAEKALAETLSIRDLVYAAPVRRSPSRSSPTSPTAPATWPCRSGPKHSLSCTGGAPPGHAVRRPLCRRHRRPHWTPCWSGCRHSTCRCWQSTAAMPNSARSA